MQQSPLATVNVATPVGSAAEIQDDTEVSPAALPANQRQQPMERGGREGPDPTRFGDWEKAGRCIDF